VEGERQDDGAQQPEVDPGGHADQRLVLRQAGGTQEGSASAAAHGGIHLSHTFLII